MLRLRYVLLFVFAGRTNTVVCKHNSNELKIFNLKGDDDDISGPFSSLFEMFFKFYILEFAESVSVTDLTQHHLPA